MPSYVLPATTRGAAITKSVYGNPRVQTGSSKVARLFSLGKGSTSGISKMYAYGSVAQKSMLAYRRFYLNYYPGPSLPRKTAARKLQGLIWPAQFAGDVPNSGIIIPRKRTSVVKNMTIGALETEDGFTLATETDKPIFIE